MHQTKCDMSRVRKYHVRYVNAKDIDDLMVKTVKSLVKNYVKSNVYKAIVWSLPWTCITV